MVGGGDFKDGTVVVCTTIVGSSKQVARSVHGEGKGISGVGRQVGKDGDIAIMRDFEELSAVVRALGFRHSEDVIETVQDEVGAGA